MIDFILHRFFIFYCHLCFFGLEQDHRKTQLIYLALLSSHRDVHGRNQTPCKEVCEALDEYAFYAGLARFSTFTQLQLVILEVTVPDPRTDRKRESRDVARTPCGLYSDLEKK